jgi:pyruvate formate lyase activating enzyme
MGFGDCSKLADGVFTMKNGRLKINRKNLKDAGIYNDICPSGAISVAGYDRSVNQLLLEIEKDMPFFRMSGGGITLTGGEPFAQDEWLFDLVSELNNKEIPVAAETCLHCSAETLGRFIPLISEFLVDLKHVNAGKFRTWTGGNLNLIRKNLRFLDDKGARYRLRIPVIPGFNDTPEEMEQIIDYATTLKNCNQVDFLPFHRLGESKYRMLGRDYSFAGVKPVEAPTMQSMIHYAKEKGFTVTTGG